ncbi:MAG: hypothetical protein U9N42_01610 [Campylobacterota bacterium]|nr:hypothetical protein [Campylobacterota bacterium]
MLKNALMVSSTLALLNAGVIETEPSSSSLIVYNSNIALVHEKNSLKLNSDDSSIIYPNVATSIINESVNVKLPSGIKLLSQQYRYDKISYNKMLEANIGKRVFYKSDGKYLSAKLLASSPELIQLESGKIITLPKDETISFDNIPTNLILSPSLVWNVKTNDNIDSNIELDYLINNITWSSNYILNLDDSSASLRGWITIDNRSSKQFKNIKLSVIAGELNRVREAAPTYRNYKAVMMADSAVAQHAVEGYHMYEVPFKTTLLANEKTQIQNIDLKDFKVTREYKASLASPLVVNKKTTHDVSQYVTTQELSLPIPAGVIRAYSSYKDEAVFLGENRVKHTPKNEKLSLKLGNNFDLKVDENLVELYDENNYKHVSIEYIVKNSSDSNKSVELQIPFVTNKFNSVTSKESVVIKNGGIVTFNVEVGSNSSKDFIVNYRAKIKK